VVFVVIVATPTTLTRLAALNFAQCVDSFTG
jgi:hypothetical protein